jgi:hypothetical protein
MRFDLPESIAAMRAGTKTQTRRRNAYWLGKKPGDRITVVHKGTYLGWTRVVKVWQHLLENITLEEAQAEGYASTMEFMNAWCGLGNAMYDQVVAIEFEPVRWTR